MSKELTLWELVPITDREKDSVWGFYQRWARVYVWASSAIDARQLAEEQDPGFIRVRRDKARPPSPWKEGNTSCKRVKLPTRGGVIAYLHTAPEAPKRKPRR